MKPSNIVIENANYNYTSHNYPGAVLTWSEEGGLVDREVQPYVLYGEEHVKWNWSVDISVTRDQWNRERELERFERWVYEKLLPSLKEGPPDELPTEVVSTKECLNRHIAAGGTFSDPATAELIACEHTFYAEAIVVSHSSFASTGRTVTLRVAPDITTRMGDHLKLLIKPTRSKDGS